MSIALTVSRVFAVALALSGAGAAQEEDGLGWPREFTNDGHLIVIYQPQPEKLEGDRLTARSAISVTPAGQTEPVFGAVWYEAFVETDRDNRLVTINQVSVPRVRFPNATEEQAGRVIEILEHEIATWDLVISLDRLLVSLETAERERLASEEFVTDPPKILVSTEPAMLVVLDGDPVVHDIEGSEFKRVVNTPFVIIQDPSDESHYLYAGEDVWFAARDIMGPWGISEGTPENVRSLVPPDTGTVEPEADVEPGAEGEAPADVAIEDVKIIVVTEPTDLIIVDGSPRYASIDGTDLLYVANTDSDVFLEIESQQYFLVLSGRWYATPGLDGPFTYVPSDSLPEDFARIPPESARGSVLVYVAGTDEALDAVLDNSIPQTSAVRRDGTLGVTYDGDPKFEAIEGTDMKYAVNTEYQVLEIDGRYYACHEAVWYEADNPMGPFTVAVAVPDDVQDIPPENPNYNVKYVYVYDSTPEVVYVGYTPGYTWSYIYGPTIVYGTGYWYRPWVSPYYYYPRPVTWGFRVSYDPWYGWSFGFGFSYGPFHFGFRTAPSYWYRPRGYWGPAGYRHGYRYGYRRGYGAGYRAGYRAGRYASQQPASIYSRQANRARNVDRATARAQMPQRSQANRQPVRQPDAARTQAGQRSQVSRTRENNVYTDRSGNVYRRNQDGNWQQRGSDGWKQADRSAVEGRGQTRQRQPTQPSTSSRGQSNLNRDYQARQRGTKRTQSYQSSRSSMGSTGARRGGRRR
jgi:hypothetical protein